MKIDGNPKIGGGRVPASPAQPTRGNAITGNRMPAAPSTPDGAQVELSGTALGTQSNVEVFDADRVSQIRQAIAEGRFQVNPERIADGLLASVRDMLTRR